MPTYKRNQVEEAIFRTLEAEGERIEEVRFRLKRLLVADRQVERAKGDPFAFFDDEPPGSGVEVRFSPYGAFALLAGLILLEHGLPQATVVRVLRHVRREFEVAHTRVLKSDPKGLFDREAVLAKAQPGMIPVDNTDPVFLAIVRLTGSSVDSAGSPAAAVCRGQVGLINFMKKHSQVGLGATFFEFVRLMHVLADKLVRTEPVLRGRGAG